MFWRSRIAGGPASSRSHGRHASRQRDRGLGRFVGRFEAIENVEVKPRVSGYLVGSHFRDGQYVRRGQLLFTIDARPAQAQLDQARAQLARAEAQAGQCPDRTRPLAHAGGAARGERRGGRAAPGGPAFGQCRRRGRGRATVRARQLDVGFTRVLAPISGQVSERRVDPGNAVTADETVLTTVVSTEPAPFRLRRVGGAAAPLSSARVAAAGIGAPVRIRLQDEAQYAHAGRLDFVDNALNSGAGTIRGRAVVPNPDGFLKAGHDGPSAARRLAALSGAAGARHGDRHRCARGASSMSSTARAKSPSGRSSSAR